MVPVSLPIIWKARTELCVKTNSFYSSVNMLNSETFICRLLWSVIWYCWLERGRVWTCSNPIPAMLRGFTWLPLVVGLTSGKHGKSWLKKSQECWCAVADARTCSWRAVCRCTSATSRLSLQSQW